jgi:hypothetical protein
VPALAIYSLVVYALLLLLQATSSPAMLCGSVFEEDPALSDFGSMRMAPHTTAVAGPACSHWEALPSCFSTGASAQVAQAPAHEPSAPGVLPSPFKVTFVYQSMCIASSMSAQKQTDPR